ncbi:hypothetical protein [Arthrobacter sp. StoSoilB13]|uniref:hypothetical protein n=1 Tax=Arthrobacter sp. StoSoilB13 TaxID=2830993 RepID=UPI0023EF25F0|nr:hypothetical protein [Arthrobacter sp. StoSoilB13]
MTHAPTRTRRGLRYLTGPWSRQRLLIVVVAVMGVGILLYPTAAAWFSDRVHATEISGYVDSVQTMNPSAKKSLLDQAREFNEELPSGPLRDPYSLNEAGEQTTIGAGSEAYKKMLAVGPWRNDGPHQHSLHPRRFAHLPRYGRGHSLQRCRPPLRVRAASGRRRHS